MNLNLVKCHLLISCHKYEYQQVQISKDNVWKENKVKLLGITIDNELIFNSHILNIYSNAKKNKCFRKKNLKNISAAKIPFKSIFEPQFKYCLLIWMHCSRSAHSKINKPHERSLRIIYDRSNSKFEDFLNTDS